MLGEIIKKLREDKEISQRKLADMLGVSPSTIGMYEQGRRSPDNEMLLKLAKIFDVSIDYLLGTTNIKTSKTHLKHESKDVTDILLRAKEQLIKQEGLMFNGEPATPEAIQSILDAMEMGMALAKEKNKKFTPKKYNK